MLPSIGIVTPTVSRAGGGIFPIVLAHARHLHGLGHPVIVYGLDDDPEGLDRAAWSGLTLRLYRAGPFGFSPSMYSDVVKSDHHILHLHGLWMFLSIVVSAWRVRTGRPVVLSTQGMLEPWARLNSAWKKRLAGELFEKRNVGSVSVIHCSRAELAGVREYVSDSKVAVIPNGTELPELPVKRSAPREPCLTDKRNLLFFGRLHPKKGVAELIEAWALLKKNDLKVFSDWKLIVAGWDDGGHASRYISMANDLGLSVDEIEFPGPKFGEAKAHLLGDADAFILPSYSEGFPMAVLEAWSYALPVFMTPECNIPEGFSENAAVRISNSPHEISAVLRDLLPSPDLADVGLAGRRLVEEKFSWPSVVSELSEVYEYLVGKAELPNCLDLPTI